MANAPWYKRFAADFVADPYVQAMTAEQYGWFSAMLDMAWIHTPQGYMPNAIDLLCRMVGRCDEMHFAKHAQIVLDRFQVTADGKWLYHPKMVEQASRLSQVSETKREAGKRGAQKRWDKVDGKCHKSAKHMPIDSDVDVDTDKKNRAKRTTSFPEGYQPNQSHKDLASSLGVNLREAFPAFRDFHQSKGSTFKDWDAALRTWLRHERKFDKSSPTRRPADIPVHTTVSCDECSDQFPVEHIGRHMTKNPVRQFCSEKCLNEYQERLVSA
jgi:uncharacterized protein YdaU (DUF1376 family)